jgi:glycosyltransferase involved in cell wall biosynthesis
MKIGIFHANVFGGVLRHSFEQARRLAERGHELRVFTYRLASDTPDLYNVSRAGVPGIDFSGVARLHDLPDPRPRHKIAAWRHLPWRAQKALRCLVMANDLRHFKHAATTAAHIIDETKCDVLVARICQFTNAPLFLTSLQTPSCWYCHEPSRNLFEDTERITDSGRGTAEKMYRRRCRAAEISAARSTSRILCNSCFSREFIKRAYGLDARLCYPGVDMERFKPVANDLTENQVICWGPLWPTKGIEFVVRSLGRIPKGQRPKMVYAWSRGSEGLQKKLAILAERSSVRLEMPRGLDDTRLLIRMGESRLCTYAPEMEPFGLVAIEAMAAGLPVVGVREGGVRESVLDGVTGFLSERDECAFADNVMRLLADDALRKRMSRAAAEHVRDNWTWEHAADVFENHLARVAEEGQR